MNCILKDVVGTKRKVVKVLLKLKVMFVREVQENRKQKEEMVARTTTRTSGTFLYKITECRDPCPPAWKAHANFKSMVPYSQKEARRNTTWPTTSLARGA